MLVGSAKDESSSLSREIARRRVSIYLLAFTLIFYSYITYAEGDMLVASFDDMASAVLGGIGVGLLALRWRKDKDSQIEKRKTNNMVLIIGLWLLVFSIFALEIEYGFPDELTDDVPKLLIAISIVINRFL